MFAMGVLLATEKQDIKPTYFKVLRFLFGN